MDGTITITLAEQGWTFAADAGATVLAAAQQAGIRLPSSCRNGTCRTCLCRLESGAVRYTIAWPGVSLDEKREGYILPCVAVADTDLVIAAPAAKKVA
ncbi:ferredoxin [Duganella sp. 3397]|uniref:2Fe-2S iron-sulfur cluster-binding protein n=1 Tax=Duganella sp. 3397 TaxID=2817732 RepID=UPI00285DBEFB|nr:2Fe-2S iron-sulfur cluster binding domain-containing protein [Duganella sp. 3397]MDR7047975.1 ferredoxin [Duganella sp. 3397]